MYKKPIEYLCENCKYRGTYIGEDKEDFENWYCRKTILVGSYVPCVRIISCALSETMNKQNN